MRLRDAAATGRARCSSSAAPTRRCGRTRRSRASGWLGAAGRQGVRAAPSLTLGAPGGGTGQRHDRDHDRPVVPAAAGHRPVPRPAPRRRAQRDLRQRTAGSAAGRVRRAGRALLPCGIPARARWCRSSSRTSPRTARPSRSRVRRSTSRSAATPSLELPLMTAGWRFAAGHRIRVAVAVSDWPNLWPLPQIAPLEITSAGRAGAARPARRRGCRSTPPDEPDGRRSRSPAPTPTGESRLEGDHRRAHRPLRDRRRRPPTTTRFRERAGR